MVAESWFRYLLKFHRKHETGHKKVVIGVLAFEVAGLMARLVHLWHSLSDKRVKILREEIATSVGIKKLVTDDEDVVASMICNEITDNALAIAKSVVRLAGKCGDLSFKCSREVFDDLIRFGADPFKWEFSGVKMEKKVKKMERFVLLNSTLHQEMELLSDLERAVKRMKGNDSQPNILFAWKKKLLWKQHAVKNLKETSLWNRTYDYTIHLLLRSLFTIFIRINHVFGIHHPAIPYHGSRISSSDIVSHTQPFVANDACKLGSTLFGWFHAKQGQILRQGRTMEFYSGPLGASSASNSVPLGGSMAKSGPILGQPVVLNKSHKLTWQTSILFRKKPHSKPSRVTQVGPIKGCNLAAATTHLGSKEDDHHLPATSSVFSLEHKWQESLPETLASAALALHYANVIILIEKLAASPHVIGDDARDDLYSMLPTSLRASLKVRLKPYAKTPCASPYDTCLAQEWTCAIASILEWLAPLAHNMIRWQSERSFEQQSLVEKHGVLLVQTLYFANLEKTEATITELLVGLNYLWRLGVELNGQALCECAT